MFNLGITHKNQPKKIMIIQARLNSKIIVIEQDNFRKIAASTGLKLIFINPLLDDDNVNWSDINQLLDHFVGSIWLGSAEVDLSVKTRERQIYINKVLPVAKEIIRRNIPALGICLGHQTFALAAGAKIVRSVNQREFGTTNLKLTNDGETDLVFNFLPRPILLVFAHNDSVISLPPGFNILGSTLRNKFSALRNGNIITIQGHPEITNTIPLKQRLALAQKNINSQIYNYTYPMTDPGPTNLVIKNFLATI